MTAAEIYALLHGHAQAFGQDRVDRYRAEAGLRLRHMRGEVGALMRWIADNREHIEETAAWVEGRLGLLTDDEASAAVEGMVKDALGADQETVPYGSGTRTYTFVSAPGHKVTVIARWERWSGRDTIRLPGLQVYVEIRTEKNAPVHFPWEPTPEQIARAKNSRSADVQRAARTRQPLDSVRFFIPYDTERAGYGWDIVPSSEERFEAFYNDAEKLKRWVAAQKLNQYQVYREQVHNLWLGRYGNKRRVAVPLLEGNEETFDLQFVSKPTSNAEELVRTVPGVTLETLADTIYEYTGVGFPKSPYFQR